MGSGVIGRGLLAVGEGGAVGGEAGVEVGEPLRVDEGLEDAAHLVAGGRGGAGAGGLEAGEEAELDDLVDVGLDLVDQARLVGAFGQEHAHQLDDVVAPEHQAGVAAAGVELGELLAQQGEQQAHRVGQRPARHQSRQARRRVVVGGLGAAAQEGVALGLVEHQLEVEHGHVFAHPRLQLQQAGPLALVGFAVEHALEQADQQHREVGRRGGGRGLGRAGGEVFVVHRELHRFSVVCSCFAEPA